MAYLDEGYVETALTEYVQAGSRLWPTDSWPVARGYIRVTLTAGYEEGEVPADLIEAVLVHIRLSFDELRVGDNKGLDVVASVCRRHLEMVA